MNTRTGVKLALFRLPWKPDAGCVMDAWRNHQPVRQAPRDARAKLKSTRPAGTQISISIPISTPELQECRNMQLSALRFAAEGINGFAPYPHTWNLLGRDNRF